MEDKTKKGKWTLEVSPLVNNSLNNKQTKPRKSIKSI
jgi:hypothetical protein